MRFLGDRVVLNRIADLIGHHAIWSHGCFYQGPRGCISGVDEAKVEEAKIFKGRKSSGGCV